MEKLSNDIEKEILHKISKNEIDGLKTLLTQIKASVNFVDENGMSPLQHACYKGNKDAVQMLIDQGADVNYSQDVTEYPALHFAALSGNTDIILLLLQAGANTNALNGVSRTASQMAAFVGNHHCVATINNYIPKSDIEYYTRLQGQQTEPYLPSFTLDSFHKFLIQTSLHPVRIALNIQRFGALTEHLRNIKKVLDLMTKREMQKTCNINEVMAFKYHYIGCIVGELIQCQESYPKDFVERFIKRLLTGKKSGELDYLEYVIKESAREFPFRECTIFRQMISQLTSKEAAPALEILKSTINGQRGFKDDIKYCITCGDEKPDYKCSKCRKVQYCNQECQKLHWFVHKKECAKLASSTEMSSNVSDRNQEEDLDTQTISAKLEKLVTS